MESAMLTRPDPGPARPIRLTRLRGLRAAPWARVAFAAMCVLALVGFFVYPTYPTYDSFYALLWGRDLLHLHLPDFRVYRGPTEHPLAIFFGVFCSIFGQGGARLMVLGSIGSFVALFQFVVPFFLLLQRAVTRNPRRLAAVSAWLLFAHWVDHYWLVMPHIHPAGPRPRIGGHEQA